MQFAQIASKSARNHAITEQALPISREFGGRLEIIAGITNFEPRARGIAPGKAVADGLAVEAERIGSRPANHPLLRPSGQKALRNQDPEQRGGERHTPLLPLVVRKATPEMVPGGSDEDPGPLAELTLDVRGLIDDCDGTAERLFGCRRDHLLGQPVSLVLPELLEGHLYQSGQINPSLLYRCRIGAPFQARPISAQGFACLLSLVSIGPVSAPHIRVVLHRLCGG